MKTYNNKPIFLVGVDDTNEGITTISLVDQPAMELPMFCFSENKVKFSMQDEIKHNIISCIVRCDYPILRVTEDGNPFYVVFNRETSEKLCQKLMTNGFSQNISLDHNGKLIDGIQLQEVFIKDSTRGISPVGFEDAADGSLFGIYHIESDELWKDCIEGRFGGVSLESYFKLEQFNKINKKSMMNKVKEMLKSILMEFNRLSTDKAELIWDEDTELGVGMKVFVEVDGERVPAEDGEYIADGNKITIESGEVKSIDKVEETPAEPEVKEEPETPEVQEEMVEETPETPVEPEEKPEDPKDEKVTELEGRIAELETKIAELVTKITELATAPAAEPVMDEFEKVSKTKTTGDKNLDKRIALAKALGDLRK